MTIRDISKRLFYATVEKHTNKPAATVYVIDFKQRKLITKKRGE